MKFVCGDIPELGAFYEKDTIWRKGDNDKINSILSKRIRFLIIISLFLSFGFGYALYPFHLKVLSTLKEALMYFPLVILCVFPMHYLLHALILPRSIKKGYFIFNFRKLRVFIFINGSVSKERYMVSYFVPFFLLTFLPLVYVTFIEGSLLLYGISYANMLFSSYDLVQAYALQKSVPNDAIIRYHGDDLYYKYKGFTTKTKDELNNKKDFDGDPKLIEVKKYKVKK